MSRAAPGLAIWSRSSARSKRATPSRDAEPTNCAKAPRSACADRLPVVVDDAAEPERALHRRPGGLGLPAIADIGPLHLAATLVDGAHTWKGQLVDGEKVPDLVERA